MIGPTIEQYRLRASLTARVVKTIKERKIPPIPHQRTLPCKILISVGLIVFLLGFSTSLSPARQAGKWKTKSSMKTARWYLSTAVANGKIYVIGGYGHRWLEQSILPTVEEYDPATNKWLQKADMPTPRYSLSASSVNGKIYAIGGRGGRGVDYLTTVEEFDPATDKWIQKAHMPTARVGLSTSVVHGKIHAIGGYNNIHGYLPTVEVYDPVTDDWTQKADMPTARTGLSTSVVNGKIFAIGGHNNHGYFPIVEMYDPVADMWVEKSDMPTPRSNFATGVVNGGIHAIGGTARIEQNVIGVWETVSRVEVYQTESDIWIREVGMPAPRGFVAAGTVNGRIYVIGGTSVRPGLPLKKVEEFTTGFAVNPAGKLSTVWGQIKSMR